MKSTTPVNDLASFEPIGPRRAAGELLPPRPAAGDRIGPESIRLVDLDGTPIQPPAPRPAALDWPRWTDAISVRLGCRDDGMERYRISVGFGDAATHVVWVADNLGGHDDDFDRAMEQVETDDPVPAEIPDPFPFLPGSDPDQTGIYPAPVQVEPQDPPADWDGSDAAGWNLDAHGIAPVSGGSPTFDLDEPFEPSAEDLDEYARWLRATNGGEPRPASYAGRLNVAMLEQVAKALYGDSPVSAR
ncbi:MAG: hypothetical protein ACYC61_14095 [Isosphaeraceae bacterium]